MLPLPAENLRKGSWKPCAWWNLKKGCREAAAIHLSASSPVKRKKRGKEREKKKAGGMSFGVSCERERGGEREEK